MFRSLPSNQDRELVTPLQQLALLTEKQDKTAALAMWREVAELRAKLQPPEALPRIIALDPVAETAGAGCPSRPRIASTRVRPTVRSR